jgi:hypothetical protein
MKLLAWSQVSPYWNWGMGLPRSFLPLLYNLRKEETYSVEAEFAVAPFSLFAFVVDSPDPIKRVNEKIGQEFTYLHDATGEDLLFFAPIDEPEGWRERMKESAGSSVLDLYEKIPDRLHSGNPERAQRIFAQSLGIRTDDLPALVVTPDLRDHRYYVLRTSKSAISGQLIGLGNLARGIGRREKTPSLEEFSRPDIDACSGLYSGTLLQNLAGLLHESISLVVSAKKESSCMTPGESVEAVLARNNLVARCRELVLQLNEIRPVRAIGSMEDEGTPIAFQTLETLARLLSGLGHGDQETFADYPFPSELDWELESQEWWAMGNKVYDFLNRPNSFLQKKGLSEGMEALDKAPALVCWSKALENELNLSAGQWIRTQLGVDLPEFFNRYQPEKEAIFKPSDSYFLDFNRRLHDSDAHDGWRMLELGPLTGAVNWFVKQSGNSRMPLSDDAIGAFGKNFEQIRTIRNRACHPSRLSAGDADDFQGALRELRSSGALGELSSIKKRLLERPCSSQEPRHLYLFRNGRVYGPYSHESILGFVKEGRVTESDMACVLHTKEWKPLGEILGQDV